MREGLIIFYFSFVEDDGSKVLYGDSVKMCECGFSCIFWEVELFVEGLKSRGVGGSSCSSCENEYWRDSPALLSEFINEGVYLLIFRWILSSANRSLVYVNSMNSILILGSGWRDGVLLYGMPWAQSMSGFRQALQWHHVWVHVHGRSQCGIVFSGEVFMNLPAFMKV